MKRKIIFLCVAVLMGIAHSYGGVTVTVPDVCIAPGGTAYVVVNVDFGSLPYTAYQLDVAYPDGISAVADEEGNPAFRLGDGMYSEKHLVSSAFSPAGLSRVQCFSLTSDALTAQSGRLLLLVVKARAGMPVGTYQATIAPMEFVQTNATPDRPESVTFNVVVSRQVVLDEASTLEPTTSPGVGVRVKRTIKAGEWSTICLPFAMTEAQCNAAFGSDVELGDFAGYEATEDDTGNIVGIAVNFNTATAIEANHPYIIKVSSPVTEFTVDGVDVDPVEKPTVAAVKRTKKQWSEMIGTYVANTVLGDPEAPVLFLSGNKFFYSVGKTKMKAYRAYFDFYDALTEVEGAGAHINMLFDGETTGVDIVRNTAGEDDACYNLAGQRVAEPGKGLYIKGNKKVIVK